ncbi:MAG: hypothetical protein OXU66_01085 [Gammaproteobacteria bacterium]|nr:hypothetical protein [Gammaproteobacteria bacterium]MDD9895473.1 hypothetical protein [Gammaproteobacteria bacterium]MDD9957510.1 hypothetical protein [Gammaproteobacteria bacterium]
MKLVLKTTLLVSLLTAASLSFAQLPELSTPTTLTGTETTAQFFGGATADNGATYATSFAFDAPIDIDLEVRVESGHVNTVGNIYVLISWEGNFFILDENGAPQLWDQSIENFLPRFPDKTLQSTEAINIVDDVAFGPAGVSDTTMDFFVAYNTTAVANEFFFNGVPLSVSIEAEEEPPQQAQSLQIFTDSIHSPIIQSNCISCHVSGGVAGGTSLVYQPASAQGALESNYNLLVNYINGGGDATLISKSQGIAHGGGVRLQPGSDELQDLQEFVNAVLNE